MKQVNSSHFEAIAEKMEDFFESLGEKLEDTFEGFGQGIETCMENLAESKTFNTVTATVEEVATDLTRVTKKLIKRIIK